MYIFLDTETTGVEDDDRLCQLAYKYSGHSVNKMFKPSKPISFEASAVNHITNKMVEDKETFADSETKSELQELINQDGIIVAHNAVFDIGMLSREGIQVGKFIDTIKMAMFLDVNAKCKKYNLQYLRYYLGLEIEVVAHDAMGDVIILEAVFNILVDSFKKQFGDKYVEKMIEISSKPAIIRVMSFGKHRGLKMEDVPVDYLEWLVSTGLKDKPDLAYTIDKILKK